jgi:hypothetical protein
MDTLCVPARSDSPIDRARKDKAIKTMRRVYTHAKAVLVLDDGIEGIPSTAPPLEITARLYQSNWLSVFGLIRRVSCPPAVWFRLKDRAVEVKNLKSRIEEHVTMLQNQGIYLGFPISANMRLVTLYSFLETLIKTVHNKEDKWILYQAVAEHVSERQTSRLADEVICLATIIDIPVDDFSKMPSKPDEVSGERRMERFLEKLGRFETGVIFNNYERLAKRGYKWAPKSLLNLRTAEIIYDGDDAGLDTAFERVNGQLGLLVQYRGFLVKFANGKFTLSFAAAERGCAIQCQGNGDTNMEIDGKWLIVQLHPNKATWTTWLTYAVILSGVPAPKWRARAVVASVIEGPAGGVYTVKHEAIATVWIQDERPQHIDIVKAPVLGRGTKWLVV